MMHPTNQLSSMISNDGKDLELPSSSAAPALVQRDDEEEELDSSENQQEGIISGDDEQLEDAANNNNEPAPKRKRFHRHTQHQIQELEAFFKLCPHPDDRQRKDLSRVLGLEPLQVKFWFQNKRTQMKNKEERVESWLLRAESVKCRAENMHLQEALNNASTCPICAGPTIVCQVSPLEYEERKVKLENDRLIEKVECVSAIAATFCGTPVTSFNLYSPPVTPQSHDLRVDKPFSAQHVNELGESGIHGPSEAEKPFIIELAVAAMEELIQMASMGWPLWLHDNHSGTNILDEEVYVRLFPRGIGPKPEGFKTEASKETAVVIMDHINLVEIFMDVNQWSSMFSSIVSYAVTMDVLQTGVAGNLNGALQVILAEFQVPSPQVPTRECYFVRYCKQTVDGIWAIVDVSLDHLRGTPTRSQRRPSGCLIQRMPNGYSKVTWIEHVDADDTAVHNIYKPLVNSGLAFGANRWIVTLARQCERVASAMASNKLNKDIYNMVISSHEGIKSVLKLAERMLISFCSGVSGTTARQWTPLSASGPDNYVRVKARRSVGDPGRPPGTVLSAATSIWLPISPKRVFDFLRDENTRREWDILCNGGIAQEMAHITNGRETGNCVSLLRVNSTAYSSQSNMLILQESSTDPTCSFVVYAPVDVADMNNVLAGGGSDNVALLPSGFAILPDGPPGNIGTRASSGGSLLTVAFQIVVDSVSTARLSIGSVATVNNLIAYTVNRIKAALLSETP